MVQEVRGVPEATALNRDPDRSIGAYLARQRELRGFTLDDLATLTRIPRRSLERLESGIFDEAPDGFVRGFVRTVAAALGLDPDEAVMRLLREPEAEAAAAESSRGIWAGPELRWVAIAAAGLLVAGGVAWLVASLVGRPETAPADEVVLRRDPIRQLASDLAAGRIRMPKPKPAAPEAPTPTPAAPEPAASASGVSTPETEPTAVEAAAAPAQAEASPSHDSPPEPDPDEEAAPEESAIEEAAPEAPPPAAPSADAPR